jgi:hypothetical protein
LSGAKVATLSSSTRRNSLTKKSAMASRLPVQHVSPALCAEIIALTDQSSSHLLPGN